MPTIGQRIRRALLGGEIERLESATRAMWEAYLDGPYDVTPDRLVAQLREQLDSSVLQDLVNQLYWEQLAFAGYDIDESAERSRAVSESRRLWRYDVITQWCIWTWTNYGFGENVAITPNDEIAVPVWDEFWTADRNAGILGQDELHELSNDLLIDGNLFLGCFINTHNGQVTLATIEPAEVQEIITHPASRRTPLYYRRAFSSGNAAAEELYYPAWLPALTGSGLLKLDAAKLPVNAKRAEAQNRSTYVVVLHLAYNRKMSLWGWPLMTAGAPWSRTHKRFREDRASVAAAVAMYVNKLKYTGGSRARDALRAQIESNLRDLTSYYDTNPPAPAGSTWLENQAATLERLSQSTGAGDARTDGEALLHMAALGGGLFPHWAGVGDAYRLATATSMEGPLLREFSRYQLYWATQFRKLVRVVLWADMKWGSKRVYEDTSAEVSTDRLVETDLPMYSEAAGNFFRQVLGTLLEAQATGLLSVPEDAVLAMAAAVSRRFLQALDVEAAAELTTPEVWGIETEQQERELLRPVALGESHIPEVVARCCPLCGNGTALVYAGHKGLLVCSECQRTYDPEIE